MPLADTFSGRRVLYVSRRYFDDPHQNQSAVLIFDTAWETRAALGLLLADDELLWESDNWVRSSSGVVVLVRPCSRGCPDSLAQMVAYEPTLREEGMDLQPHHARECRIVRAGKLPETAAEPRERRARASSGPRAAPPGGSVHVSVLALQMGIEPSVARGALRKIMSKPAWGWRFLPAELDDVKAKIAERLK